MKTKFREIHLSKSNREKLEVINRIISEYQSDGYVLTLRQLYYQLVSRDIIPNKDAEYKKVSNLLKEGRMAGVVDWDAIEDRLRVPKKPSSWDSPKDMMQSVIAQFQLPRMKGQPNYIEVWVEKDALSGVLSRVTERYHVPILVNRGYSSVSAMYDSYQRFAAALEQDQKVIILYLGDYDPSGIDMIRDIRDRITEFLVNSGRVCDSIEEKLTYYPDSEEVTDFVSSNFEIIPIALTREQINAYNPPPNPAKKTDPRSRDFIASHGSTSWEVDALRPEVLNQILTDSIELRIDMDMYESQLTEEKGHVQKLKDLTKKL